MVGLIPGGGAWRLEEKVWEPTNLEGSLGNEFGVELRTLPHLKIV